ncbi:MAG: UDP-N-acetylmuramate dehydrogenase [Prevotella sp.]
MILKQDHCLLDYNTFGIDARCARFVEFADEGEISGFLASEDLSRQSYLILGGGSNLLLTADFQGTVFHSAIRGYTVRVEGTDVFLRCGSGEKWDDIVALCVENGWHGAENLSHIPGDVGASAVQNIGAYGVEVGTLIYKVEAVEVGTGLKVAFGADDCAYAYRDSRFKHEWRDRYIITHVTYRLSTVFRPVLDYGNLRQQLGTAYGDALAALGKAAGENLRVQQTALARQLRQAVTAIRDGKLPDPKVCGNAGSFFMNPVVGEELFRHLQERYPDMPYYVVAGGRVKIPAGWLIEQCGWKGKAMGKAGVHDRQALVLVNLGGATGRDILNLSRAIQADVERTFGIQIKPEVNIR